MGRFDGKVVVITGGAGGIGRCLCEEFAREGAQVLHDRSVELAMEYGVTIQVLSSFRLGPGTLVKASI